VIVSYFLGNIPEFAWWDWERKRKPVRISGLRDEIWTRNLPNTKQDYESLNHDVRFGHEDVIPKQLLRPCATEYASIMAALITMEINLWFRKYKGILTSWKGISVKRKTVLCSCNKRVVFMTLRNITEIEFLFCLDAYCKMFQRVLPKYSLSLDSDNWTTELWGRLRIDESTSLSLVFCPTLILMALLFFLCEDLFRSLVPVNALDKTTACNLGVDAGSLKCKTNSCKGRKEREVEVKTRDN
jgi:hypothetical protein